MRTALHCAGLARIIFFMPILRFATYLAPNMRPVYEFIARTVAERLGVETELFVGEAYEELVQGAASAGFI